MHIQTSNQEPLKLGFGDYGCNWGTHLCGLYETVEERDEIICGFLNAGLSDNSMLAFVSPGTDHELKRNWAQRHPENASMLDACPLEVLSPASLYFPNGSFSPWAMEEALEDFFATTQQQGRRTVRSGAEMDWALERIPGSEHLMAYEARLNLIVRDKPWVTMCLYDITRFSGATIVRVLQTHPYCISGRVITHNPFYRDPVAWLRDNAPEFLTSN
jgi:hypothetical protein